MAEGSRTQRPVIVTLGWLGATVLATGVALAAVSSIGTGIFGSSAGPLDQQQITDALATVTPPPEPTVITSAGGTAVARCTVDDRVEVLSWSPAQGFRVDNAEHGPARDVEIEFESGEQEVEIKVRCVDGEPHADIEGDG